MTRQLIQIDFKLVKRLDSIEYQLSSELVGRVVKFYKWIGYEQSIPQKAHEIISFANAWFRAVVMDNLSFPNDIPFHFVMKQWILAINNNSELMPKQNIPSFTHSLNKFLKEVGHDRLRYLFEQSRPLAERPRQLEANNPLTREEIALKKAKTLEAIKELEGDNWLSSKLYQATLNLFEEA